MVITNLLNLLWRQGELKTRFEKEVFGDFGLQIERSLGSLVDWMIEKSLREFQNLVKMLVSNMVDSHRPKTEVGTFSSNRAELAGMVTSSANLTMNTVFDKEKVGSQMTDTIRRAAMSMAAIEIGAVGVASSKRILCFFVFYLSHVKVFYQLQCWT